MLFHVVEFEYNAEFVVSFAGVEFGATNSLPAQANIDKSTLAAGEDLGWTPSPTEGQSRDNTIGKLYILSIAMGAFQHTYT